MSQHKRQEELVVIQVLENDGTVSGITTDIVPDLEAEGTSGDFIVVSRITGLEDKTKSGEPTKTTRVQVDCYSGTKSGAATLADAAESALKAYSGTTYGDIDVVSIFHDSDNPSRFDSKPGRYRISDDYGVKVKV